MKSKNIKTVSCSFSAGRGFISMTESFTLMNDKKYDSSSIHEWTGHGFLMTKIDGEVIPFHRSRSSWVDGSDSHLSIKQMMNSRVPLDCIKIAIA